MGRVRLTGGRPTVPHPELKNQCSRIPEGSRGGLIRMSRSFVTLDVFTSERFAGNPLAVVLESEGLDTAGMQQIAKEFNLSETVFVLPPSDPRQRADIRIFTPARELPFAGHPTVGTAVLLALLDQNGQS